MNHWDSRDIMVGNNGLEMLLRKKGVYLVHSGTEPDETIVQL